MSNDDDFVSEEEVKADLVERISLMYDGYIEDEAIRLLDTFTVTQLEGMISSPPYEVRRQFESLDPETQNYIRGFGYADDPALGIYGLRPDIRTPTSERYSEADEYEPEEYEDFDPPPVPSSTIDLRPIAASGSERSVVLLVVVLVLLAVGGYLLLR